MATITASATGGNSNATGAWVGGVVPGASDDVILAATSGPITFNANFACRSFDASAYTSTLTHNAAITVTIGTTTVNGSLALALGSGMTYVLGSATTSVLAFSSTSTTQGQITAAGKTLPAVSFTGSATQGSWLLVDGFTVGTSTIVTFNSGILNTNGQTCSWGTFTNSGGTARTLTLGASSISITNSAGANGWNCGSGASGCTLNAGTSTITIVNGATFSPGEFSTTVGLTYYNVVWSTPGTWQVAQHQPITANNITVNATATKTSALGFQFIGANHAAVTVAGTLTLTGNSTINRLLLQTSSVGTAVTITAAATSITNVDFIDVTGAGAASPFTGTSLGDGQGNTGITFDAQTTQTWTGNTAGNWSDATKWTSRVPLPQDTAAFNALTSATVVCDMPRLCANIDCTGSTGGSLTMPSQTGVFYGNITWAAGVTWGMNQRPSLAGRGSQTITTHGQVIGTLAILAVTGTYQQQDNFTTNGSGTAVQVTTGTWDANNFNWLGINGGFTVQGGTVLMGSGTWAIDTGSFSTGWAVTSGTVVAGTSTIVLAGTLAQTFAGGGKTYNNVTVNSQATVTFSGSNTFNVLTVQPGAGAVLTAGTTQTVSQFVGAGQNYGYLSLPGAAANYATTPSTSALQITGDITIDAHIALPSWSAPGGTMDLVSKSGNNVVATDSYSLIIGATGILNLGFSDGTSQHSANATVSAGTVFSAGQAGWVRATRKQSTGILQFYTSPDGVTWTQLGANVTLSLGTAIQAGPDALGIGAASTGVFPMTGAYYEARIYNGYQGTGTLVLDANFTLKAFGANSFTEASTNAATVTITGVSAIVGDGRVQITSTAPGTQASISQASGLVSCDWMVLQDSHALGGAAFYAGADSTNVSDNTGWTFADTDSGASTYSYSASATGSVGATSISGAGSSVYSYSATAAGVEVVPGAAGATYNYSAAAMAGVSVPGGGSSPYLYSASATGSVTVPGSASSAYSYSASAAGSMTVPAQSAVVYAYSGALAGGVIVPGGAGGVYSYAASASGSITVPAPASVSYSYAASAAAGVVVEASASSTYLYSAAAAAVVGGVAAASVVYAYSSTAPGSVTVPGGAVVVYGYSGTAGGLVSVSGAASVVYSYAASATALVLEQAAGQAIYGYTSTAGAQGIVPAAGSTVYSYAASANAIASESAAAAVTYGYAASAPAAVSVPGGAIVTYGYTGQLGGGVIVPAAASSVYSYVAQSGGLVIDGVESSVVYVYEGSALGMVQVPGSAATVYGYAASVAGVVGVSAAGETVYSYSASATGSVGAAGGASIVYGYSASLAGKVIVTGAASVIYDYSTHAAGAVSVGGAGIVTYAYAASVDAETRIAGAGRTVYGYMSSAGASVVVADQASVTYDYVSGGAGGVVVADSPSAVYAYTSSGGGRAFYPDAASAVYVYSAGGVFVAFEPGKGASSTAGDDLVCWAAVGDGLAVYSLAGDELVYADAVGDAE